MSTRSQIAIKRKDGKIESIYCHSDGYLEYNGVILNEHYRNINKINHLINLGDISSLGEQVFPNELQPHDFDYEKRQENVTVAYGRDRGEKNVDKHVYENYEEYLKGLEGTWCEYLYLYDEELGKWFWSHIDYEGERVAISLKDLSITLIEMEEHEARTCTECGKEMNNGYCINDGLEYYCSDTCLHKNYTEKEHQEMYEGGSLYWTEWED